MGKLHQNLNALSAKIDPIRKGNQLLLGKQREQKIFDTTHFLGTMASNARDSRKAAEAAAADAANQPVMPIPDEEALQAAKRKNLARRNRGRASTILASPGDSETLG